MKAGAPPRARAYTQPQFISNQGRWVWTIVVNDKHQSIHVATSVQTFPTEHDANTAAKAVLRQLTPYERSA